jgi:anti-sigma factor RsiW
MNDCVNAEIRDQLPDLVHDRLSAADRTVVLAHVEGCVDCREELQLLRDARAMFTRGVPRVDVAYVVGALPKAPAPRPAVSTNGAGVPARRRTWSDWRIAAAVTLLIAGGGSYAVLRDGGVVTPDTAAVAITGATTEAGANTVAALVTDSSPTGIPDVAALVEPIAGDDQPAPVGSMDTRLGDLTEDQLNTLLNDIENLRAIPASEPEPGLRMDARTSLEER